MTEPANPADVVIVVHEPPGTLQGIVDELVAEHFPGMPAPTIQTGLGDDYAEVCRELIAEELGGESG